jgi:hypothetical protein
MGTLSGAFQKVRPSQNARFCSIAVSGSNFNPRNIQYIPPVKIFAFLALEQNGAFFKGLKVPVMSPCVGHGFPIRLYLNAFGLGGGLFLLVRITHAKSEYTRQAWISSNTKTGDADFPQIS